MPDSMAGGRRGPTNGVAAARQAEAELNAILHCAGSHAKKSRAGARLSLRFL